MFRWKVHGGDELGFWGALWIVLVDLEGRDLRVGWEHSRLLVHHPSGPGIAKVAVGSGEADLESWGLRDGANRAAAGCQIERFGNGDTDDVGGGSSDWIPVLIDREGSGGWLNARGIGLTGEFLHRLAHGCADLSYGAIAPEAEVVAFWDSTRAEKVESEALVTCFDDILEHGESSTIIGCHVSGELPFHEEEEEGKSAPHGPCEFGSIVHRAEAEGSGVDGFPWAEEGQSGVDGAVGGFIKHCHGPGSGDSAIPRVGRSVIGKMERGIRLCE